MAGEREHYVDLRCAIMYRPLEGDVIQKQRCALFSISQSCLSVVQTKQLGLHDSKAGINWGGFYLSVFVCLFVFYCFYSSVQNSEKNIYIFL